MNGGFDQFSPMNINKHFTAFDAIIPKDFLYFIFSSIDVMKTIKIF